jgi:hypothetical protein
MMGDADSCYGEPPTPARAAFIKESRMKFANANKLGRKSGGAQRSTLLIWPKHPMRISNGSITGIRSCYGHTSLRDPDSSFFLQRCDPAPNITLGRFVAIDLHVEGALAKRGKLAGVELRRAA